MLRATDQLLELSVDPNRPLDFRELGISTGIVALFAGVLLLYFGALAGPPRRWLRPRWVSPPRAWYGYFIAIAYFIYELQAGAATEFVQYLGWFPSPVPGESRMLSALAARTAIAPLFFASLTFGLLHLFGPRRVPTFRQVAGWIALGAAAWFVLDPATTGVHILTLWIKQQMGGPIDVHPLAKLHPTRDGLGGAVFGIAVCVMTPWVEEYFFRGLLIPWAMRRWYSSSALIALAFLFALGSFGDWHDPHFGALLSVAILGIVLIVCQCLPKTYPKRTILAVVSTSALFAAAHSAVWPSPIPLFVLALGLGYLKARTGSIVPGVVVHGLFNGASFVYLLRSPIT